MDTFSESINTRRVLGRQHGLQWSRLASPYFDLYVRQMCNQFLMGLAVTEEPTITLANAYMTFRKKQEVRWNMQIYKRQVDDGDPASDSKRN